MVYLSYHIRYLLVVWLRWRLADMGVTYSSPMPLYHDSKSVIQIAHNSIFHEHTKHIEFYCHFVRHHLQFGTIALPFVSTTLHLDDFFMNTHYYSLPFSP